MNFIKKMINRIRFKKSLGNTDESINVVDSIVKAHALYKELARKTHPDLNRGKEELATSLMAKVAANKNNYSALLALKEEIEEKLGK